MWLHVGINRKQIINVKRQTIPVENKNRKKNTHTQFQLYQNFARTVQKNKYCFPQN